MAGRSPYHNQAYSTPTPRLNLPPISEQHRRSRSPAFYASLPDRGVRSEPMSIRSNSGASPPPPLPPPRWIEGINEGNDPGWEFENRAHTDKSDRSNTVSVKPGSSLLGGHKISPVGRYNGPARNIDFENPPPRLEGVADVLSEGRSEGPDANDQRIPDLRALLDYNNLQSERPMGQKTLERSSQAYDKQLLSRIGGPRTPPFRSADSPSTSTGNQDTPASIHKPAKHLRPLAMPERRYSDMDTRSPHTSAIAGQWSGPVGATGNIAPQSSAASPGIPGRSPQSENGHNMERTLSSIAGRSTNNNFIKSEENPMPGRLAHRNSYEGVFNEQDLSTHHSPAMQQLNIQSQSPGDLEDYKTGQKRRAQSPPTDAHVDPRLPQYRPSQAPEHRLSQAPRFQAPSSLSSAASSVPPSASYPSSYQLSNPSSATSYNSEQLSPAGYGPDGFVARASGGMPPPPPSNLSTAAPRIPQHGRQQSSSASRPPGLWICDCCPKKPKKFDSEDELRIHEMEKQYICQYCNNRFKNKNEAERHQNSLHLRRHSWSCAALTSFEAAFHSTPPSNVPGALRPITGSPYGAQAPGGGPDQSSLFPGSLHSTPTDSCGYCGQEFINPPNWEERVEHLNHVHKFGECNQSKKFFRADHFRQHLKHSHAGTSGKWTNQLENACMKDEPPPQPLAHGAMHPVPGIIMVGQQALMLQHQQTQQQEMQRQAQQAQQQQQHHVGQQQQYVQPQHSQHQQQHPPQHQLPQAGQQALMHATGPMGSGGSASTPMPSIMSPQEGMLSPGMHQQQGPHSPGYFGQGPPRYQTMQQGPREDHTQ